MAAFFLKCQRSLFLHRMKWKHVIAVVCLLVLGTQVLPLKQLGSLLSSNTVNEELPHGMDDGKDIGKASLVKENIILPSGIALSAIFSNLTREYIHFAVSLPDCHAGDIHTPPPNVA